MRVVAAIWCATNCRSRGKNRETIEVTIANCAIAPRSRSAKKGDRTPKGKNLSLMGGKTTIRATGSSRGRYGHFCRTGDPETVTISQ